jgi:hypothetical protein
MVAVIITPEHPLKQFLKRMKRMFTPRTRDQVLK